MSDLYTFVGHRGLRFANPFSEASMERAIEVLRLAPGARVADFGAGACELPIRLAERYGAEVVAVELSPRMAALARDRVMSRLGEPEKRGSVTVLEGDAGAFRAEMAPDSFDLTVCVGSAHALGGLEKTVRSLAHLTRPGGHVLIGQHYWQRRPSDTYLEFTGMHQGEARSYADTIEQGTEAHLTPVWSITATEREWDEYEWAIARNIEEYAAARIEEFVVAGDMLARSRRWRQAYWRWGRRTMGFGLFLFKVEL